MPDASLSAVLEAQLARLQRHLPRAREGRVRSVHQARVASRRLREVLPIAGVASPDSDNVKLDRLVRRITKALGPVREMDVALEELSHHRREHAWRPRAVDRLRAHLTAERDRRAREMHTRLDRLDQEAFEDRVHDLAAAVVGIPLQTWGPALGARVRKRAGAFGQAVQTAGTLYVTEPVHEVRIAAKKLRYTLELAQVTARVPVGRQVGSLRRLQDALGRLRDLQVVQEQIRALLGQIPLSLAPALEQIGADLDAECRTLHAEFVRGAAKWLSLAGAVEKKVAPMLSRTPIKMSRWRGCRPASIRETA